MSRANISVIPETRPVNSTTKLQLRWLRIHVDTKPKLLLQKYYCEKSPSKHSSCGAYPTL